MSDQNSAIENTSRLVEHEQEPVVGTGVYQNIMVQIKTENDNIAEDFSITEGTSTSLCCNLDVKQEIPMEFDKETAEDNLETIASSDLSITLENNHDVVTKVECPEQEQLDVKEEMETGDHSLVSYDYPNFDDVGSMDSNDIAVLGNVETCLQEYSVKIESGELLENPHHINEETEIIPDKISSTKIPIIKSSVYPNLQDGLLSQLADNLIKEILPLTSKNNVSEEILPTSSNSANIYEETFQLNSITGNVLSLEQEAYSLLKAKKNVKGKTQSQKTFTCKACSKVFNNSFAKNRHMAIHRTIERRKLGVIKGLKTKEENKKKSREAEEKRLMEAETKFKEEQKSKIKKECEQTRKLIKNEDGYECTCGQVYQRRIRLETCIRSHNEDETTNLWHQCTTCLKLFSDKKELLHHRRRAHRKKFQCKFCPTDYNTRKELFKHLQIHQKVQLMEYKVISEAVHSKKKLRCFMCPKSFAELSDLKSHVMEDHESPYTCPNCKNTFPKIIEFANHVKTYHPDIEGQSALDVLQAFSKLMKAWKCEECELQFHEADKLAIHRVEKHNPELKGDPQFQCTDCQRVFISQKGLTSHKRVHHSESIEVTEPIEKGIMCVECRKMCKDEDALTSHMRLHSPDRKYPCKFCDFRFATPEKRKSHAEIHTGDMKYVCFICEYQCSSENRLKQHKESLKHANIKEFLLTGKPLIEEEPIPKPKAKKKKEDKKKDKEASCDESMRDPEVCCDICGEKFVTEEIMLEHKQTHPFIEFPNEDTPTRIFFK